MTNNPIIQLSIKIPVSFTTNNPNIIIGGYFALSNATEWYCSLRRGLLLVRLFILNMSLPLIEIFMKLLPTVPRKIEFEPVLQLFLIKYSLIKIT